MTTNSSSSVHDRLAGYSIGQPAGVPIALLSTTPTNGFPITGLETVAASFDNPPDLSSLPQPSTQTGSWAVSGNDAVFTPDSSWPFSGATTFNFDGVTSGGGAPIIGSSDVFFAHLGITGLG